MSTPLDTALNAIPEAVRPHIGARQGYSAAQLARTAFFGANPARHGYPHDWEALPQELRNFLTVFTVALLDEVHSRGLYGFPGALVLPREDTVQARWANHSGTPYQFLLSCLDLAVLLPEPQKFVSWAVHNVQRTPEGEGMGPSMVTYPQDNSDRYAIIAAQMPKELELYGKGTLYCTLVINEPWVSKKVRAQEELDSARVSLERAEANLADAQHSAECARKRFEDAEQEYAKAT